MQIQLHYSLQLSYNLIHYCFTMTEFNGITVGYWNIRGLGAPLRMMCMYADIPFKAECFNVAPKSDGTFDASNWFKGPKPVIFLT